MATLDHPFNAVDWEMLAFLRGGKTTLRIPLKPQPQRDEQRSPHESEAWAWKSRRLAAGFCHTDTESFRRLATGCCPLGPVGAILWVRETWAPVDNFDVPEGREEPVDIGYRADLSAISWEDANAHRLSTKSWNWQRVVWRSQMTLPRWASRVHATVTSIDVVRIDALTEEQARTDGAAGLEEARAAYAARDGKRRDPPLWYWEATVTTKLVVAR